MLISQSVCLSVHHCISLSVNHLTSSTFYTALMAVCQHSTCVNAHWPIKPFIYQCHRQSACKLVWPVFWCVLGLSFVLYLFLAQLKVAYVSIKQTSRNWILFPNNANESDSGSSESEYLHLLRKNEASTGFQSWLWGKWHIQLCECHDITSRFLS